MARYRRKRPTGREHVVSSAASLVVGAGAALVGYYVARLLLAREELPGQRGEGPSIGASTRSKGLLRKSGS